MTDQHPVEARGSSLSPGEQDPGELERVWREILLRPDPAERLDAIISHPRAEELVGAIPDQDLFLLVQTVGLADATELVAIATPEQFRAFIDLGAWRHDELDIRAAGAWLRALVVGGCDDVPRRVERLDVELLALMLKRLVRIHEVDPDDGPPAGDRIFFVTYDGRLALEILDPSLLDVAKLLIDSIVALTGPLGLSTFLSAVDWELPSGLSETAYRWRRGRLEDLGFIPRDVAMKLYTPLTPRQLEDMVGGPVAKDADTTLPRWLARREAGRVLGKAVDLLEPEIRARVEQDLVYLFNGLMVASAVDPGDEDSVKRILGRARAYLEMALASMGADTPERASVILTRFSPRLLFRFTVTGLLELRKRAVALESIRDLVSDREAEWIDSLGELPPRLPGDHEFRGLDDLSLANGMLAVLESIARLLGERPELHELVQPGHKLLDGFGTWLVREYLGLDGPLGPIPLEQFQRFLRVARGDDGRLLPEVRDLAHRLVTEVLGQGNETMVHRWLGELDEEWSGLDADAWLDPRYIAGVVVAGDPGPGEDT